MSGAATVGAAATEQSAVSLDVWADIACPWCFLGHRTLEQLLTSGEAGPVQRRHRAFVLRSDMPARGIPYDELMTQIFGSREAALPAEDRLTALGGAAGIRFDFSAMPVAANSRLAHQAVLASEPHAQTHVLDACYNAYWERGMDITDPDTVLGLAVEAGGGTRESLLHALSNDTGALAQDLAEARTLGVQAVPTLIADGRLAVQGAQPPELLTRFLAQARAQAAPSPTTPR